MKITKNGLLEVYASDLTNEAQLKLESYYGAAIESTVFEFCPIAVLSNESDLDLSVQNCGNCKYTSPVYDETVCAKCCENLITGGDTKWEKPE